MQVTRWAPCDQESCSPGGELAGGCGCDDVDAVDELVDVDDEADDQVDDERAR